MQQIRKIMLVLMLGSMCMLASPAPQAQAAIPIITIIREAVTRAIKAVDLMVQRLQNKTIWLQQAQKILENKLHELKLGEIAEWTEKHRQLYAKYYQDLWEIKNAIGTLQRVRQIMLLQVSLTKEYQMSWTLLRQDDNFTPEEIAYLYTVYSGILIESVKNLDQVLLVINSFKTQMTDAKRLEIIQLAEEAIQQNYSDLKRLNTQQVLLSLNRAKDKQEIESVKKLYGL